MEQVSSLYRVYTISICFNHAHVSSRVVPPYTFGIKPPILSLYDHSFIQVLNFPIISTSDYGFCRTQGAEICTLTQAFFFDDILGALWGIALLGNTEVVPWDLGKTKWRCQGAEICMWTQETALILYSTMIFPAMDSGSFILRFRQQNIFLADLLARGTPNPSQPQIRRITVFYYIYFFLSTPPKKYLNTIELVIVCSDWYFHEQKGKWMGRQIINPVLGMTTEWRIRINNIETSKGH